MLRPGALEKNLLGTNISHQKWAYLKMIFLFPRWEKNEN